MFYSRPENINIPIEVGKSNNCKFLLPKGDLQRLPTLLTCTNWAEEGTQVERLRV